MAGAKTWTHGEEGDSADFDAAFYKFQPRSWLAGISTYNLVVDSVSATYEARGFLDIDAASDVLAFVFEHQTEDLVETYSMKVEVYVPPSGTRDIILDFTLPVTTTWASPARREVVGITGLSNNGDLSGEKLKLEVFLKATNGKKVELRNMRIYCGTSGFASDYMR